MELSGRSALVTGGATGIGFGIVEALAAAGATVALMGRRSEVLDDAVAGLGRRGFRALAFQGDVRDFARVQQVVDSVAAETGGLDILVNNAAGNFVCPAEDMSANGWKAVIDIDLNGTFHCCRAAYAQLAASRWGGRIISIVSDQARHGWPGCAHAGAAKAGVMSLMRTLAVEWGPRGIRSNCIAPGPIADTEGANRLVVDRGRLDAELARIPIGRLGTAAEIGRVAVFLASAAGDFINGADIVVDGGRTRTAGGAAAVA